MTWVRATKTAAPGATVRSRSATQLSFAVRASQDPIYDWIDLRGNDQRDETTGFTVDGMAKVPAPKNTKKVGKSLKEKRAAKAAKKSGS
jgi:hypothetical protein